MLHDKPPSQRWPVPRRWGYSVVILLVAVAIGAIAFQWPPAVAPLTLALAAAQLVHGFFDREKPK
ncbi:hypothetical protein [Actinocorallia sp. A-T 12471]|uniref:hypothetical protein n=1 Tax=Actinocorallia sp. A-T 12471 TaxID=3089813 RepID=UPI0029D062CB|nr:hypothetical protein [Actinocorallia sp. A-T 12471]MDX6739196.1 hypothetical protein [Actinocorallia sp. A-T 12471]